MAMEKLQNKIKNLYTDVKTGKIKEEIADEISDTIDNVEYMGDKAKVKFNEAMSDVKKSVDKMKE